MNKINSGLSRRCLMAAALAAGLWATPAVLPAQATETIKMIAIDGYPARAMWVKEFSGFFIPRVNELLAKTGNYKIEWQEGYGGTIVKPRGVLEGIRLGLGDIGIVTTIFHSSKLPSQGISAVTPFISADARVVAKAVDEIAREFPQMAKELDAENQVYLATGVALDSYQLFSKTAINSLEDLKGKKVAGAGYNLRYLEGIEGAAGVRGGLPDFYNMLQTGVVDRHALARGGKDLQDRRGRALHAQGGSWFREYENGDGQQGRLEQASRRSKAGAPAGRFGVPRSRRRHCHG